MLRLSLALMGTIMLGAFGCATATESGRAADRARDRALPAVERQLAGHLSRIDACMDQLRDRDALASGLVEARFTILPTGRVGDVEVTRNTSYSRFLRRCVERKIGALYFSPAPASPLRRAERWHFCEQSESGTCRLGPVRYANGARPTPAVRLGLRDLDAELARCQATHGDAAAVLQLELQLSPDGRVRAGRVRRASPPTTPLRGCAIQSLLGRRVAERVGREVDDERVVRFTVGLSPRRTRLSGASSAMARAR